MDAVGPILLAPFFFLMDCHPTVAYIHSGPQSPQTEESGVVCHLTTPPPPPSLPLSLGGHLLLGSTVSIFR